MQDGWLRTVIWVSMTPKGYITILDRNGKHHYSRW